MKLISDTVLPLTLCSPSYFPLSFSTETGDFVPCHMRAVCPTDVNLLTQNRLLGGDFRLWNCSVVDTVP